MTPHLAPRRDPDPEPAGPCTPLNVLLAGPDGADLLIRPLGRVLVLFPRGTSVLEVHGADGRGLVVVPADRYLVTTTPSDPRAVLTVRPWGDPPDGGVAVVAVNPAFVREVARFVGVPLGLEAVVSGLPLSRGDRLSTLLAAPLPATGAQTEDLLLAVVAELLRAMHTKTLALARVPGRPATVTDLCGRLARARQLLEARFREPLEVADVAREAGFSPFHFSRLFSIAFETTVGRYRRRLRLDEARRLIQLEGRSVTDAALEVGFESPSSFSHAFRREFGRPPSSFKPQG